MSNQLIPVTFSASALKPAMTVFPPVPTALFLWYLRRHLIKSISSSSLADLLLEKAKRNRIHPLQILCWKKQNERVITREGRRNMQFYGLARISWFHYVAYCFAADTNFSFVSFVCFFCLFLLLRLLLLLSFFFASFGRGPVGKKTKTKTKRNKKYTCLSITLVNKELYLILCSFIFHSCRAVRGGLLRPADVASGFCRWFCFTFVPHPSFCCCYL